MRNRIFGPSSPKYSDFRPYSIRKTIWGHIPPEQLPKKSYKNKRFVENQCEIACEVHQNPYKYLGKK